MTVADFASTSAGNSPVEQAALQHARQAHPMVQRGVVGRAITRMRPHSVLNMADPRRVKSVEPDRSGILRRR